MKKFYFLGILVSLSVFTFAQVQRTSVLEQFTTERCSNCPPVLTVIENHLDVNHNFIIMGHHSGYYTDWLTIPENTAHLEFFNDGGSIYAPAGMVDRHYNGLDNDDYNGVDPGPVFWDGEWDGVAYGPNRIDERTNTPAFVTVNLSGEKVSNTYNITVFGEFLSDFSQEIGISLWITEDSITTTEQSGASGTWTHRFTVRDAISSRLGDVISTSTNTGDTYSKTFSFNVDQSWDLNNCYMVAFINNIDASNVNNREIHNATQEKLLTLAPLSTSEINKLINIYPTIAKNEINITNSKNSHLEIYNILGNLILSKKITKDRQSFNVSSLKNGSYFVKIKNSDNTISKKIIISR